LKENKQQIQISTPKLLEEFQKEIEGIIQRIHRLKIDMIKQFTAAWSHTEIK
jgi:aspartate/tyrosine/aromatic aminotransferase